MKRVFLLPFSLAMHVFLLLAGGCAEPPSSAQMRILWPLPPQQQRLEFVGVYASEEDFSLRTERRKFLDLLLGRSPQDFFRSPFGIVAGGNGKVYVSDRIEGNVKVIDLDRKTFKVFVDASVFSRPHGMDIDDAGNLYVADGKKKKVLVFSPQGRHVSTLGGADVFGYPAYVSIHSRIDRIYVSDAAKHRIAVFDRQGRLLFFIGGPGDKEGQFARPQGLTIDRDGHLFVADMLNARIQVFDADGKFLRAFGEMGTAYWCLEYPRDLEFASDGTLFVADHGKGVLAYTPAGDFLFFTGSEKRTSHPLGFSTPAAIAIDAKDRLYITDQLNERISVWQVLSAGYLRERPVTEEDLTGLRSLMQKAMSH